MYSYLRDRPRALKTVSDETSQISDQKEQSRAVVTLRHDANAMPIEPGRDAEVIVCQRGGELDDTCLGAIGFPGDVLHRLRFVFQRIPPFYRVFHELLDIASQQRIQVTETIRVKPKRADDEFVNASTTSHADSERPSTGRKRHGGHYGRYCCFRG